MNCIPQSLNTKKYKWYFVLAFLMLFCQNTFAQKYNNVQWASYLLGFSSEYVNEKTPRQCGAAQILGKPNKLPATGSSPCAWSPALPDSREDEWIHVGFLKPMKIKQIVIGESHNAGAITKIFLYDLKGKEYLVYKNLDTHPLDIDGRMFHILLKETTPYEVSSLKVVLNTMDVPGWNHLDAIGISESSTPIEAKINIAKDIPFTDVESLGKGINTEYDEILPVISPDGKTLYFDRKNHPANMESDVPGKPNDDIWFSFLRGTNWETAQKMKEPLNNGGHNFVCSVTPDGNTLLLGNAYLPNGDLIGGVSISHKTADGGWTFPKPLKIDNYYNRNIYSEFFLSQNKKVLLLAIERDDSFGGRDIYVSFLKSDDAWTVPQNIGPVVNTAGTELTPFLASDGKSLYFASNGHSGYGSSDMFVSRRLDDTWENWSEPMNLGPTLNSKDWDASYTLDATGEYAYFVSYKNSINGSADLFRAKLPQEVRPEPVILISGTVYNAKTKLPISADIVYEVLSTGKEVGEATADPKTGQYKIVLPISELYGFRASSKGFLSVSENIDLKTSNSYKEIKKDLYLVPIEVGQTMRLNNVFFKQGTDILETESYPELDRICKFMKENPTITIELGGHTDIEGIPVQNMKLSHMRVTAIQNYMTSKGLKKERIITKAYGSTMPISRNRDEESKQLNRRVEFKILSY